MPSDFSTSASATAVREAEVVRCTDVVRSYWTETGAVHALKGIDVTFRAGALTSVVGPSGSGKSSLLRVLAGLDPPTSGTVEVAGVVLSRLRARALRKIRRYTVGYVFQRPSDNFVPHLTVAEHLELAAPRRLGAARSEEVLGRLGLADRVDHLPEQLSGGEQQRAAVAQVLVAGPSVIMADEPTSELDGDSSAQLLELMRALVEDGIAFVVATHDRQVAALADDVVEMDHGVVTGGGGPMRRGASRPSGRALVTPTHRRARSAVSRNAEPHGAFAKARDVPLVAGRELVKRYRRGPEVVHALDSVDVVLRAGRVVGLMGRSGSGKTTLLNVVAGWEHADAGTLTWSGEHFDNDPTRDWSSVAVIPQHLGLIEELSVRRNIEYPALLSGRREELRGPIEYLIDALGLAELQDRAPNEASLGQQQRIALARALVLRPRLLLADEPTAHQDAGWTRRIFKLFNEQAGGGGICLIATHNEDLVDGFDEVMRLSNGRIVAG